MISDCHKFSTAENIYNLIFISKWTVPLKLDFCAAYGITSDGDILRTQILQWFNQNEETIINWIRDMMREMMV
jgi:hypothetical protein